MNRINVTKATMPTFEEYTEEIKDLFESHWITNHGKKTITLKKQLIEYMQVPELALFTNGHLALELSLQALNLKKEGEVITTPFTFASTTHAITRNHLTPVFCDINEDNYTIDVDKIEDLITDKTVAILPVHVYGNICDVERIEEIAQKYDLKVVYDAAHAFGETYKGRGVGIFGDISMFSFHATKVFNTIEGGAVCFHDPEIGGILKRLKNFGIRDEERVDWVGSNAKMNEFQAAMGICNLKSIDSSIKSRKKIVELYNRAFFGIKGLKLNVTSEDVVSNYSYYPVVIDEKACGVTRNQLIKELQKHNIFPRKYFYPLINELDCYRNSIKEETPVALNISKRVLTLPLYSELKEEEVSKIVNVILDYLDSQEK